jgi:tRNA threonylcarbamoyl adenosine modification protein YeaZ
MPVAISPNYGLALHTTSPQLGLALSNLDHNTRVQTWDLGRDISNYLHQYLLDFLRPQTWQDLAFLAVAKGPGGFTGTRIGMVTARTLAQQLEIPVFAISTLAAVAVDHLSTPQQLLAIEMEARRGQCFVALYAVTPEGTLETKLPDTTMTPQAWQEYLDTLTTPYQRIEAVNPSGQTVAGVLYLAQQQWQQGQRPPWSTALPFYGQHPVY